MRNAMMNKPRKILIATLLGAGLVVAGGAALAHKGGWHEGGRHGEGPRMERMMERMAERLELDEQQQASIRTLIEEHRPLMQENRQAMRDSRRELHDLVRGDAFDEAALRSLAAEQGERMAGMIVERGLMMRAIRDVLTPEQRAEAEQMLERRMERHHGRGWGDKRD
jgi:periplasmic protein CpxP/Spy